MTTGSGILFLLLLATVSGIPQSLDYETDFPSDGSEGYADEGLPPEEQEYENVELEMPEFASRGRNLTVRAGEKVHINCSTVRENQRVTLIGKLLEGGKKRNIISVGPTVVPVDPRLSVAEGVLEIAHVKPKDAGAYQCYFTDIPVMIEYNLEVQFPPSVQMKPPRNQKIPKGSTLTLECSAAGNPPPVVSWSRQGKRLPSGEQSEQGRSLTLVEVDRHMEGTYRCTAENGVGPAAVADSVVVVEYAPEIVTEKDLIRTGEGDVVDLVCIVHALPPAEVEWFKDGKPLESDPSEKHLRVKDGAHRHTLKIQQVSHSDFGEYKCRAENFVGVMEEVLVLTDLPMKPVFTSDRNGGLENSYTLTWETESYYPITEYQINYRTKGKNEKGADSEWTRLTKDVDEVRTVGLKHSLQHVIADLQPATDYEVLLAVKNRDKWSDEASYVFSTRKAAPLHPTDTGSISTSNQQGHAVPPSDSVQETVSQQKTTGRARRNLALEVGLFVTTFVSLVLIT